jgi:lipopolysaccharide export system protein LptC
MRPTWPKAIAYNRASAARPPEPKVSVRNIVVMVVLAILAAATWFATWQRQDAAPSLDPAVEAAPLGYFARGARIVGTDEEGRPTYRIFAERLDEVPGEERLELTGVDVDYQPAQDAAWSLSADTAQYARDGSRLDLAGSVEIRSAPTDGEKPVTINTQSLLFLPDTSRAEADETVQVRVGDWQLSGVGLRADLKERTLELESVRGTLAP